MTNLTGKTVVVTGAAGGLGRALCENLGARHAKILALDIDEDALVDLRNLNLDIETFGCDLTDEKACSDILSNRSVDILINNAGITHFSRFEETTVQTIQKVMTVNFFAAVAVTKAVLPALKKSKGAIVAVSSVAGFSPLYGRTGYSASKHAMLGFFSSLRAEVRDHGVCVMIVCPSFIATQQETRNKNTKVSSDKPGSASQTVGKPLTPQEVAEQICRGLEKDQKLLIVGRIGKLSYWLNKLFPQMFEKIMISKMKAEFN